jgi:glycerol-1-phosphate dehydrogenase [NAD(P)+]
LAAKIPSGTEWVLADFLGVEPIHNVAWHIVHDGLKESLSDPVGVAQRKPEAIATLVEGLMLSGFAMQAARSSIPASGTEHLFSHLWNMRGHTHNGRTPSHGYQVSVGTLMMCAMFDEMCKTDFSKLDVRACVSLWKNRRQMRHEAEDLFEDMPYGDYVIAESMARYKDKEEVRRQLQLMKDNWPDIKEMLQEHCYTHEQMYQLLSTVGAPTSPEQVGISLEQMRSDVAIVRHIRNRFTMFDIGLYAGKLQDWTAGVFGEGGIWEIK